MSLEEEEAGMEEVEKRAVDRAEREGLSSTPLEEVVFLDDFRTRIIRSFSRGKTTLDFCGLFADI